MREDLLVSAERIREELLKLFGRPHAPFSAAKVAGSIAKSSCAAKRTARSSRR